ncbi:MAG: hypothetical protein A2Y62_00120 [Candidatus Fischerbacteria bacterium RBG_13_37_8]|uniref:Uncharacterized protein n=1 Tax=Candidatus Fischerbacteria bacterium RBG_13_37_8 TaxID=1817863 RepID=A0A1F5V7H3_9BACT|nr:MAG: hypothetical protein A2Y62_00120 [Candidatus Fischerbacteria bacterium RBG_13_37_8]
MSGKERSANEMEKLQEHFIRKALVNGLSEEIAHEIWRQIASFAGYAFCKAHSASYAQLSFKVAYLKAHYPAEFMAAVLSNQGGFYHPSVYLSETRHLGLRILLPDINKSHYHYTTETYPPVETNRQKVSRFSRQCNAVRIGFLQIKYLSRSTITAVINQRKNGPYASLEDFLLRTDVPCSEVEILIKIGAMNFIQNATMKTLTIPQLLWKLKLLYPLIQKWKTKRNGIIAKEPLSSMELPDLPEYSLKERIKLEEEYLGMPVSVHPIVPYLQNKKMNGTVSSRHFKRYVGKIVRVVGWLTALKRITTSKGEYMLFISFEDMDGFYEATLFPQAYSQSGSMLTDRGPYRVTGTVNNEYGSLSINVATIQHL